MTVSPRIISSLAIALSVGVIIFIIKSPYNIKDWFQAHDHHAGHEHGCCGHSSRTSATSTPTVATPSATALVLIDNAPFISQEQLQAYIAQYTQEQPELRTAWAKQDVEQQRILFRQLLQTLITDELVKRYVHDQGWDADPEFIRYAYRHTRRLIKQMRIHLLQQHMMRDIQSTISNESAKILSR